MSLYDLISAHADRTPSAIAIAAPGRAPLSYERLREQVANAVTRLHAFGIGRNDRVALVLPDGPEAVVAILSVASVATCAPLDRRCRASEFAADLAEMQPKAVIVPLGSASPMVEVAGKAGIAIIELAMAPEQEAGIFTLRGRECAPSVREGPLNANDVILLLHTSGTTARPRLVPLTQANVIAGMQRVRAAFDLTREDRYLNVAPLSYSHGISLTLASIGAGSSVVCPPGFLSPRFFDWIEEFQPTWYSAAPTVHQAVLTQYRGASHTAGRHRFRFIRSAAAPLPRSVRERLEELFQSPVIEAYGMTECFPVTCNPLPPAARKAGSVGPAAGTDIAILDERGERRPAGSTGEVAVRGPHMMRGYLHEPSGTPGIGPGGWFRTGDLGHLDSDGYLFITARIKDIINRGGEKISPCEVDNVLLDHPAVAEAVTFSVPHATLGEDVAVAIVLRDHASTTGPELQAFAGGHLPPFKVPRHVIFVNELPKGATGKVRRSVLSERFGLPAVPEAIGLDAKAPIGPSTREQGQLLAMAADLLGVDSLGIEDNFFDLGGNSLLALQLIARVADEFGKQVPLPAFLEAPTIRQLAAVIANEALPDDRSELVFIQRHGPGVPLVWVHGDASNWFLATYLGPQQPLFGFEHQSCDRQPAQYTAVETIAAHYLDELRKARITGPVVLGGFSFGGLLAFEMAQQLQRRGERVELLVLLDAPFPGKATSMLDRPAAGRLGIDLRQRLRPVARVWRTLWYRVRLQMRRPIPTRLLTYYLLAVYLKARRRYRALPYSGRVVYIESEKGVGGDRRRWTRVLGNRLEWHEVPGDHLGLITRSYARPWMALVKTALDSVRHAPSFSRDAVAGERGR